MTKLPLPSTTTSLKVYVRLTDGTDFFARVFVHNEDRVQDLLNDKRKFLPVQRHYSDRGRGNEDVWSTVVLNKESIILIEEI